MSSLHPGLAARRLAELIRDGDGVSKLAAIHAMAPLADPRVDLELLRLLLDPREPFATHAAWAFACRPPCVKARPRLEALLGAGGLTAMLAERTLLEWSWRRTPPTPSRRLPSRVSRPERALDGRGLVVIQPFLHAQIDGAGSRIGAGEAGGIASLLRTLGTALAKLANVERVVTVTRRHPGEAVREEISPGHVVQRFTLGSADALACRDAWVYRTELEHRFTALGEELAGYRVVWHLRMAEVGTLAAASAARRLGQPIVFTVAPDPHIVIDAMQENGRLDRASFAEHDAAGQLWFRARMVSQLAAQADRLTPLPRPSIERELTELLGVDPTRLAARGTIVAEGVDIDETERARARLALGVPPSVERLLQRMSPDRRALPWVLTVGRLHPVKGVHRLVAALADDDVLAREVNLVVVGGDLEHPSADERHTMALIERAAANACPGLVTLAGHLSPREVSELMAYTADAGLYVCASDKEEFGLAIVESLAAGAVVVAPLRGGPRSYVVDGDTGVLCDTLDVRALRLGIVRARALLRVPGRAARAMAMVRRELSVARMAGQLGGVYAELAPAVLEEPR